MDILKVYEVKLDTILKAAKSLEVLTELDVPEKDIDYVHLQPQSFVLSDKIEYYTNVVTAHKLSQYKNRLYSIKLKESIDVWLDILIQEDIERRSALEL